MASGPITSWQIDGETMKTVRDFISLGSKITADSDCIHEIKRLVLLLFDMFKLSMKFSLTPWEESYDQPRQHIQKQRHYFANKGPSSQNCGFSCGHVWM